MSAELSVSALTASLQALQIKGPQLLVQPLVQHLGSAEMPRKEMLQLVQLIYKLAKGALQALQKGQLESFDALVSDCACQIRAIMVVDIAIKMRGAPECAALVATLEKGLQNIQGMLNKMQAQAQKMGSRVDNVTVAAIREAGLEIPVSEDIATLTLAYMLTQTKNLYTEKVKKILCADCGESVSPTKEVTEEPKLNSVQKGIKPNVLMALVREAKKNLAAIGVRYLQAANVVPALALPKNILMIQDRMELPCIFTIQAMMRLAAKNNIAILVKVRHAAHLCESLTEKYDVELLYKPVAGLIPASAKLPAATCSLISEYGEYYASAAARENMPTIVIEGQRCDKTIKDEPVEQYRARLLQERLLDILEMNATAHKQYSKDGTLPELQYSPPEEQARLQAQAARAFVVGAAHENQRLFSITHIFASMY